jgi:hypothetical protein
MKESTMKNRWQGWETANAAFEVLRNRQEHAMWYLRWSKGMSVVEIAEAFQVTAGQVDCCLERYERDRVEDVTLSLSGTNVLRLSRARTR